MFTIISYRMKIWTLNKADVLKFQAFEMLYIHGILNILSIDKITDLSVKKNRQGTKGDK